LKCQLCRNRPTFHTHHFDGEEIDLGNLNSQRKEKYLKLEENGKETVDLCVECHSEVHGNVAKWSPIKMLYKYRKDLIEERKATENRIRNLKQYELDVTPFQENKERLENQIKEIESRLKPYVRDHKLWRWLEKIYGISEINAAGLIAKIGDISNFDTVSDVWAFFGLRPKSSFDFEDGCKWEDYGHYRQATKEKRTLAVYNIGEQFIRKDSFYRQFYDERREETESDERFGKPEDNKSHYYRDGRRYATKIFLSHLYEVWRRIEGLETREPYILQEEHHHYIKPPYLEVLS